MRVDHVDGEMSLSDLTLDLVWKLDLLQPTGMCAIKAFAFGKGPMARDLPKKIDVLFSLGLDDFNGNSSAQLLVDDLRPSDSPEDEMELENL